MAQDGFTRCPQHKTKMAPRWPKEGRDVSKMAQDGIEMAPDSPKMAQSFCAPEAYHTARPEGGSVSEPVVDVETAGARGLHVMKTHAHLGVVLGLLGHLGAILGPSWAIAQGKGCMRKAGFASFCAFTNSIICWCADEGLYCHGPCRMSPAVWHG